MLFNSFDFALFLPLVFCFYWLLSNNNKIQNVLIVIASYVFYGWWDWRFLSLIFLSTILDYSLSLWMEKSKEDNKRKRLLWLSLVTNLGLLGFFKYYNFFLESFVNSFSFFGITIEGSYLKIILPVGISFYTFQTLSYTIDVYRKKLNATKDFIAFSAFVSFFPQLVAGPIERATNLLPQFYTKRFFDVRKATDGLKQMLWGFFKKIVIADGCAEFANKIFDHYELYAGSTLFIGALFFTFQIYCDFSGYSDIAIGTSRLFGFELMKNFSFPYFSRDIAEFWRRWHISLSTWFRDYLYIPLGGSKGNMMSKIRNTFIIFLVSGFWHGANWTFIAWGLINAMYFLPLLIKGANRNNMDIVASGKLFPGLKEASLVVLTFILTIVAWIFFRAENLSHAFSICSKIASESLWKLPEIRPFYLAVLLLFFVVVEWLGRESNYAIEKFFVGRAAFIRWSFYIIICFMIIVFQGKEQEFIYFQF